MSGLDLDAKIALGFRARLEAQRKTFKCDRQREYRHRFLRLGYVQRKIDGHWDWYKPLPNGIIFVDDVAAWYRLNRITPEQKKALRK
jgi:hypothetical protein